MVITRLILLNPSLNKRCQMSIFKLNQLDSWKGNEERCWIIHWSGHRDLPKSGQFKTFLLTLFSPLSNLKREERKTGNSVFILTKSTESTRETYFSLALSLSLSLFFVKLQLTYRLSWIYQFLKSDEMIKRWDE